MALISDIVASQSPKDAATPLRKIIDSFKRSRDIIGSYGSIFGDCDREPLSRESLLRSVGKLMDVVRKETPMIHQVSQLA